jgi:hypothetical protein
VNPGAIDPGAWADGWVRLAQSPGFAYLCGLIALFVVCKWPPWRKGEK